MVKIFLFLLFFLWVVFSFLPYYFLIDMDALDRKYFKDKGPTFTKKEKIFGFIIGCVSSAIGFILMFYPTEICSLVN